MLKTFVSILNKYVVLYCKTVVEKGNFLRTTVKYISIFAKKDENFNRSQQSLTKTRQVQLPLF